MSFLLTEDKTEMIVTCNCACGDSVRFKVMSDKDDRFWAIWTYLCWGHKTEDTIRGCVLLRLKRVWRALKGRDYYLSDMILYKDDVVKLRDYLNFVIENAPEKSVYNQIEDEKNMC